MKTIVVSGDTVVEYAASAIAAKKQVRLLGYNPNKMRADSPGDENGESFFWFGGEPGGEPELVVRWTEYEGPSGDAEAGLRALMELAGA